MANWQDIEQSDYFQSLQEPEKETVKTNFGIKQKWQDIVDSPYFSSLPDDDIRAVATNFDQKYGSTFGQKFLEESEGYNILGGIVDTGKLIYDILTQVKGALGGLLDSEDSDNFADRWRDEAEARNQQRRSELGPGEKMQKVFPLPGFLSDDGAITRGDIQDTSSSTGFSAVSLGSSLLGGAVGSLSPDPFSTIGAAMAAGGAAAFKMDRALITDRLIDSTEQALGRKLSGDERQKLLEETAAVRRNHALWEAGPEALGNALSLTGIGKIFSGVAKNKLASAIAGFVTSMGGELSTETVTQIGQNIAEHELGIGDGEKLDWSMESGGKAVKQVAPTVLMLGGGASGAAAVAGGVKGKIVNAKQKAREVTPKTGDPLTDKTNEVRAEKQILEQAASQEGDAEKLERRKNNLQNIANRNPANQRVKDEIAKIDEELATIMRMQEEMDQSATDETFADMVDSQVSAEDQAAARKRGVDFRRMKSATEEKQRADADRKRRRKLNEELNKYVIEEEEAAKKELEGVDFELLSQAQKEAESIVRENPAYQHMAEAKRRGGLSLPAARQMFSKETIAALNKKYPGLFADRITAYDNNVDEFAQELGYESADQLVNEWLGLPSIKAETARLVKEKQAEWDRYDQMEAEDAETATAIQQGSTESVGIPQEGGDANANRDAGEIAGEGTADKGRVAGEAEQGGSVRGDVESAGEPERVGADSPAAIKSEGVRLGINPEPDTRSPQQTTQSRRDADATPQAELVRAADQRGERGESVRRPDRLTAKELANQMEAETGPEAFSRDIEIIEEDGETKFYKNGKLATAEDLTGKTAESWNVRNNFSRETFVKISVDPNDVAIDDAVVNRGVVRELKGKDTPPPVVHFGKNNKLVKIDGAHRIVAARQSGKQGIEVYMPENDAKKYKAAQPSASTATQEKPAELIASGQRQEAIATVKLSKRQQDVVVYEELNDKQSDEYSDIDGWQEFSDALNAETLSLEIPPDRESVEKIMSFLTDRSNMADIEGRNQDSLYLSQVADKVARVYKTKILAAEANNKAQEAPPPSSQGQVEDSPAPDSTDPATVRPETDGTALSSGPSSGRIITDPVTVQRIKNSIADGMSILSSGEFNGKKRGREYLEGVYRQVVKEKARIGDTTETPNPTTASVEEFEALDDSPRLSALHSLTAENLLYADKVGGLAVPSIAVVKEDMGMTGYGGITLVGTRNMADPAMNPVYDSDAYTTTFPSPAYNKAKSKDADELTERIRPYEEKYVGDSTVTYQIYENAVNGRPEKSIDQFERSPAMMAMFLDEVYGINNTRPILKQKHLMESISDTKAMQQFFKGKELEDKNAIHEKTTSEYRRAIRRAAREKYQNVEDEQARNSLIKITEERYLDEEGNAKYAPLDRMWMDRGKVGKKSVDNYATQERLERKLKGKEAEYKTWLQDTILGIHGDPFIKNGKKKVPYTLPNIVEAIKEGRVKANENTLTFGDGKARAFAATEFDDLEVMRNYSWQMGTPEEIEAAREDAKKKLEEYRNAVIEHYKWDSTWDALDDSMKAIAKFAKKGGKEKTLRTILRGEGFVGVPDSVLALGVEARDALLNAPVPYFESKPLRSVHLAEFPGAVIPNNTKKEVIDVLKKNGIEYIKYGKEFDEEARRKAVIRLRKKLAKGGKEVLFSLDQAGTKQAPRTAWQPNFPDAVIVAPKGSAQQHPDYEAAKKDGDGEAAYRVVSSLLTKDKIAEIGKHIRDNEVTIATPVVSQEAGGKNAIPRAFAEVLSDSLNIKADAAVMHVNRVDRGGSDGFHRLAVAPTFSGKVESGKDYIILDDTLTQGGTLAALKGYIESNGGNVILFSALTGKQYSAKVAVSQGLVSRLRRKYPGLEDYWKKEFGYGFDKLTQSEARYLVKVKGHDANSIRDRVSAIRRRQGSGADTSAYSKGEGSRNVQVLKHETTMGELLESVKQESSITGQLANLIAQFIPDSKLNIKVIVDPSASAKYTAGQTNTITVRDPQEAATALHEIIHSVTVREMEARPRIKRQVTQLMNRVKRQAIRDGILSAQQIKDIEAAGGSKAFKNKFPAGALSGVENIAYSFLNEKEFLAQAFSSQQVQGLLKNTKMVKGKLRTAWDAFVQTVARALGIKGTDHTAFGEALSLAAQLAQSDVNEFAQSEDMALEQAKRKIQNLSAFKEWFGDSVVTVDGKPGSDPLVVYHGTRNGDFTVFDPSRKGSATFHNDDEVGFHFTTDKEDAKVFAGRYAKPKERWPEGSRIIEAYLSIENPYIKENSGSVFKQDIETAIENGHDGIIVGAGSYGEKEYVVFSSSQIKTTTNTKWSPTNPDISEAAEGAWDDTYESLEGGGEFSQDDQRAMRNTSLLNAEVGGKKSTAGYTEGEQIVEEILRKLSEHSIPSARQRFQDDATKKLVESYRKAKATINNPRVSISEKQKFAAELARKTPEKVRARLMAQLAQISRVKTPKAQHRRLKSFMVRAEGELTGQLRRDLIARINKRTAPLKSQMKGGDVKKGRGAAFERDLDFIRSIYNIGEMEGLEVEMTAKRAELQARHELLSEQLGNAKTPKQAESIQEKINDIESFTVLLDIFGAIHSQSFDELIRARDALKTFMEEGVSPWREQMQEWADLNARNRKMVLTDMTGRPDPELVEESVLRAKERSAKGKAKEAISVVSNLIQSWELMMDKISSKSGQKTLQSNTVKYFGSVAHKATRDYEKFQMDTHDKIMGEAMRIFKVDSNEKLAKKFAELNKPTEDKVFLFADEENQGSAMVLSPLEAAYWYQVSRSLDNQNVADTFNRMGITDKTLDQINDLMSPELKEWADYLVDEFYQDFHDGVNDVYRQMYGIDLEKTVNYVPFKRKVVGKAKDKDFGGFLHDTQTGTIKKGSLRQRVPSIKPFRVMNLNDVLVQHVADMNHFKAWALPSRVINGTFTDPEVQTFIRQEHGRDTARTIRKFQSNFVKSEMESIEDLRFLDKVRGNVTRAMIGMNPVVFLKQLASMPAYMSDIPSGDWVKYTTEALSNPKKAAKILGESTMMKSRYKRGFERDIATAMGKGGSDIVSQRKRLGDRVMVLTQLGDKLAIVMGGYAVYKHHLERLKASGMTHAKAHQEALRQFEISTERAQQSANTKDLGWFQSGSPVMKLFTMYMTAPASYSRQIFAAFRNAKTSPGDSAKRLFVFAVLMPILFQTIADALLIIDGDDEDKERAAENLGRAIALGPLNGLPIIRTMMEGYSQAVSGEGFYRGQFSPAMETFETSRQALGDFARFLRGGTDQISEEEYLVRSLVGLVHTFGYGAGVPTKPVQRLATGWLDALDVDIPGRDSQGTTRPFRRAIGFSSYALGDNLEEKFSGIKRELNGIKDKVETAPRLRGRYGRELLELRRVNKLQTQLNKLRERSNNLRKMQSKTGRDYSKLIRNIEERRLSLIRTYMKNRR